MAAAFWAWHPTGVYASRQNVYFVAPALPDNSNRAAFTTDGVIATAGLVAQMVDPRLSGPNTTSETSLSDEGYTHAERVKLPNAGGQWSLNFNQPVLDLQVVGTDPTQVDAQMRRLQSDVLTTLQRVQQRDGVRESRRITTAPVQPATVTHLTGDRRRATMMTVLLGSVLTLAAASWVGTRRRVV